MFSFVVEDLKSNTSACKASNIEFWLDVWNIFLNVQNTCIQKQGLFLHSNERVSGQLPPQRCSGTGTCSHIFFMYFFVVQ